MIIPSQNRWQGPDKESNMNFLNGWLGTLGASGVVAVGGILAVGGGAAALHQSSLLDRSHAMPVVIQPVSSVAKASDDATTRSQADDRGIDANDAADDNDIDANQGADEANEPAGDRGLDPNDDRGGNVAAPAATPDDRSGSGDGRSRSALPTATASPSSGDEHGRSGDSHGGSGGDGDN
jgi:hypothetical protein